MLTSSEIQRQITDNLYHHLNLLTPQNIIRESCQYAVIPPGKLFRPLLASSSFQDLSDDFAIDQLRNHSSDLSLLTSFLEIHHAYTLVHDDLPCMDDDDTRRGRPSLHKAYNEWLAVLTGDALLVLSFQLLSKIKHQNAQEIISYCSWALGPKGLILGQVMDLSEEMTTSFSNLKKTHQYKTARLIQCSLTVAGILADAPYKLIKDLHRLGHHLGLIFQFLDDLTELSESSLSPHESLVNPWINFTDQSYNILLKGLDKVKGLVRDLNCKKVEHIIYEYLNKMQTLIHKDQKSIYSHLPKNYEDKELLTPVMTLLK